MRCPKCGYISFDRQKSCSRCSNDLTAVAEQLQGTVVKNAVPFFLGTVLGARKSAVAEPEPALRAEEEAIELNELEGQALPEEEEELNFPGPSVAGNTLEEQAPPSIGLEDIDVSDLVSLEEEEPPTLPLESEEEEDFRGALSSGEESSLIGSIDWPSLSADESMNIAEPESLLAGLEDEAAEVSAATEDEEIIDLSSLMDFEEVPETTADSEESQDILDISFGEEPADLPTSLEGGAKASAEAGKKTAGAGGDIADSVLTLEKDEQ